MHSITEQSNSPTCVPRGLFAKPSKSDSISSLRRSLPITNATAASSPNSFAIASDHASLFLYSEIFLTVSNILPSPGINFHPSALHTPIRLSLLIDSPLSYLHQVFIPTPASLAASSIVIPRSIRLSRISVPNSELPFIVFGPIMSLLCSRN